MSDIQQWMRGFCNATPSPRRPVLQDREVSFNEKDHVYDPDPDQMVNLLITVIMRTPGQGLPAHYTIFLLHVLEAYRTMKKEILGLQAELQKQRDQQEAEHAESRRIKSLWQKEKDMYMAEVKKLGREITEGKKAAGEMALTRPDLVLERGQWGSRSDPALNTAAMGSPTGSTTGTYILGHSGCS